MSVCVYVCILTHIPNEGQQCVSVDILMILKFAEYNTSKQAYAIGEAHFARVKREREKQNAKYNLVRNESGIERS